MANKPLRHRKQLYRPKKVVPGTEEPPIYLAQWMDALGIIAAKLAVASGVSESYISQITKGDRANPSAKVRAALADGLEIPARFLFEPPPEGEEALNVDRYGMALLARLVKVRRQQRAKASG